MSELTKYRVRHCDQKNEYDLELYRDCGTVNNEWVKVDQLSGLSAQELKQLADFIYSLLKKKA